MWNERRCRLRDLLLYLRDIHMGCRKILRFTRDLSYEEFVADEVIYDATLRNLTVIGEAVKAVPIEMRERYPDIECRVASDRWIPGHRGSRLLRNRQRDRLGYRPHSCSRAPGPHREGPPTRVDLKGLAPGRDREPRRDRPPPLPRGGSTPPNRAPVNHPSRPAPPQHRNETGRGYRVCGCSESSEPIRALPDLMIGKRRRRVRRQPNGRLAPPFGSGR